MAWPPEYGQQVSGLSVNGRPLKARVFNEREVRAALAMWEDHIRTLVEGGERKIIPLPLTAT